MKRSLFSTILTSELKSKTTELKAEPEPSYEGVGATEEETPVKKEVQDEEINSENPMKLVEINSENLMKLVGDLSKKGKNNEMIKICSEFKVTRLRDIPQDKWPSLFIALKGIS